MRSIAPHPGGPRRPGALAPAASPEPTANAPPHAAAPGPSAGLAHAREFVQAHVASTLSLSQFARVAGLSKYHFLRSFTRAYGMSPHAYQMQLRLELARRYIAEGRPLGFVAYAAGFADQSHLTRRFKERYGVTPGAFARDVRAVGAA